MGNPKNRTMAEHHLYFDGGCTPNPGTGAWGAALYRVSPHGDAVEVWAGSGPAGTAATSNTAEFAAAIGGLRGALSHLTRRPAAAAGPVRVRGDSTLVVKALAGAVVVRDRRLARYAAVARGLLARLPGAVPEAVPRAANARAHGLAAAAAAAAAASRGGSRSGAPPAARFAPTTVARVTMAAGNRLHVTAASTDVGGDRPGRHCLIDAAALEGLPRAAGGGRSALASLRPPPAGVALVRARGAAFPVLGVVHLNADVEFPATFEFDDDSHVLVDIDPLVLLVVDGLPAPLHIAVGAAGVAETLVRDTDLVVDFDAEDVDGSDFGAPYGDHPFWD